MRPGRPAREQCHARPSPSRSPRPRPRNPTARSRDRCLRTIHRPTCRAGHAAAGMGVDLEVSVGIELGRHGHHPLDDAFDLTGPVSRGHRSCVVHDQDDTATLSLGSIGIRPRRFGKTSILSRSSGTFATTSITWTSRTRGCGATTACPESWGLTCRGGSTATVGFVSVSHGDIPSEDSFRTLDAIGYRGPISIE